MMTYFNFCTVEIFSSYTIEEKGINFLSDQVKEEIIRCAYYTILKFKVESHFVRGPNFKVLMERLFP